MALPKKSKKRKSEMDDNTFDGVVRTLAADARLYVDQHLQPSRIVATQYFKGQPFGDENEDEAQVVMSTIRDKVNEVLPNLFKVFAGSETAVEFVPRNESEVQMTEEATDAVNHIFWNDCDGFSKVLDAAFQDALIRKSGILYWWFEEKEHTRDFVHKGKTEAEMLAYLSYPGRENMHIVGQYPIERDLTPSNRQADPQDPTMNPADEAALMDVLAQIGPEAGIDPTALVMMAEPERFDWRVRETTITPRPRVAAIPPEQYIISRSAVSETDAVMQGRQQVVTVSDLVSIGHDRDEILENRGATPSYGVSASNTETQVHNPALLWGRDDQAGDPSLTSVLYSELYCRIDKDGDGIAELWRVETIGENHYVLSAEIFEECEAPFAILCPYPDGHSAIGDSLADYLVDLQEIISRVWRGVLDSLTASIYSRLAVVEGQVNYDDVIDPNPAGVIRQKQPNMVQEIAHSFVGGQAAPVLQALEDMAVKRTGVTPATFMDPNSLQSTSATGIDAAQGAAAQTVEMIARRFAENGLKRMFEGLLRMICRHVDRPLDITKRDGTLGQVDPRTWSPQLMTTVNVGLGRGTDQQRFQALQQTMAYQEKIVAAIGLSDIVGPAELRASAAKLMQIGGIKDVSKFIKPIPAGWRPPVQQGGQMSPQLMLAQGQIENDRMKLELERMKMQMEFQLKTEQLASDRSLKLAEIQARYGSQLQQAQMDAQIDIEKHNISLANDHMMRHADLAHQAEQAGLDRAHQMDTYGLDQHAASHDSEFQHAQAAQAQPMTPPANTPMTPPGAQP